MIDSLNKAVEMANEQNIPLWKAFQTEDCNAQGIKEEESFAVMKNFYLAMKETDRNYDPTIKSDSKMIGGEADMLKKAYESNKLIIDSLTFSVMEKALHASESNACMRRIVASPTAGSCGVMPAVLLSYQELTHASDDEMTKAMYVAGGIGGVIAKRASLAGASGGCQAEIGSASGMAAGALAYLQGGDSDTILNACAIALKGLMGLVCDPVAGLVEVPCVKRNVVGAMNAVTAAQMAVAGIQSVIPCDEVIDAMAYVGRKMPEELRETSKGGLAKTPTGKRISKELK